MKIFFSIIFCLLLNWSLSANTEKNTNDNIGGSYDTEKTGTESSGSNDDVELEERAETESESEPDSSYYSVNKFNFLFYFVYKMKYMDNELEIEPTEN